MSRSNGLGILPHVPKVPALSAEDEARLADVMNMGSADEARRAREQFILANVGLVVRLARPYRSARTALDDLVSWGFLGLIEAVDSFDASRGYRFSTYAYHRITASIRKALYGPERLIDLPKAASRLVCLYTRAARELREEGHRDPEFGEVCDRMERVHGKRNQTMMRSRRWRELVARALGAGRIDRVSHGQEHDDEAAAGRAIAADGPAVGAELEQAEEIADLAVRLRRLSPFERAIVTRRYGLDGSDRRPTHREIGEELGAKRTCVQMAERRALAKLAG